MPARKGETPIQQKERLGNEKRLNLIDSSVRRGRQGQAGLVTSAVRAKTIAPPPKTTNYHEATALVLLEKPVLDHDDYKVRRLAGQYVKVLLETAEKFQVRGVTKVRVGVIPLELPVLDENVKEPVTLSMDFIRSEDPVVNALRA